MKLIKKLMIVLFNAGSLISISYGATRTQEIFGEEWSAFTPEHQKALSKVHVYVDAFQAKQEPALWSRIKDMKMCDLYSGNEERLSNACAKEIERTYQRVAYDINKYLSDQLESGTITLDEGIKLAKFTPMYKWQDNDIRPKHYRASSKVTHKTTESRCLIS